MKKLEIIIGAVAVAILLNSCKIQDAPGAYAVAKGGESTKLNITQHEEEPLPEVYPLPNPDVRKGTKGTNSAKGVVEEPVLVSQSELDKAMAETPMEVVVEEPVKAQPETVVETPKDESKVEPEITRKEKFEVVAGQQVEALLKYNVVIGSFGKQTNAQNLQAQMRPQYKPIVVVNERGMYRVILATFDEYKDAKLLISELLLQFPDAWVLVQK